MDQSKTNMQTVRQFLHAMIWAKRRLFKEYHPLEIEPIKNILSVGDDCIDVGAHAGAWVVPLSRLTNHVYAFEALPYYASTLTKLLSLLRIKNATVYNRAVSVKSCSIPVVWKDKQGRKLTGNTYVASNCGDTSESILVEGIKLDDCFSQHQRRIGFVKCVVNGAEYGVLLSAINLYKKHRPLTYIQINDTLSRRYNESASMIFSFFRDREYHGYVFDQRQATYRKLKDEQDYKPIGHHDDYVLFMPAESQL